MAVSLDVVRSAIAETNAGWTASVTSVSRYAEAPAGDVNLFGLNIGDEQAEQELAQARSLEAAEFHVIAPPPTRAGLAKRRRLKLRHVDQAPADVRLVCGVRGLRLP